MEKNKTKVLTHELCADMISWSLTNKDKILPFPCFPFEQRCATIANISAESYKIIKRIIGIKKAEDKYMTNRAC